MIINRVFHTFLLNDNLKWKSHKKIYLIINKLEINIYMQNFIHPKQ